jgi:hypothetical protein
LRRANKGQTSKYEDFERDIPEHLIHSSNGVPSHQATPVTSYQERSLDWDNNASDPTFLARPSGLMDKGITNVADLNLLSDTTSSSVFELQPVPQQEGVDHAADDESAEYEEPPPSNILLLLLLPQQTTRSFSVINCSKSTCKPKRNNSSK